MYHDCGARLSAIISEFRGVLDTHDEIPKTRLRASEQSFVASFFFSPRKLSANSSEGDGKNKTSGEYITGHIVQWDYSGLCPSERK